MVTARNIRRNLCGNKKDDGKEEKDKNTKDWDVFQQGLILKICQLIQLKANAMAEFLQP